MASEFLLNHKVNELPFTEVWKAQERVKEGVEFAKFEICISHSAEKN